MAGIIIEKEIANMATFLNYIYTNYKERTAFSFTAGNEQKEITYGAFAADVNALRHDLQARGYCHERIALIGENSYSWIVAYFAITTTQNTVVPLDREITLSEASRIVKECESRLLIHSADYRSFAENLAAETGIGLLPMTDFPVSGADFQLLSETAENPDDIASIIYTSGTTGSATGVQLRQKSICLDTIITVERLDLWGSTLLLLPFHHSYAWTTTVMCSLLSGIILGINQGMRYMMRDFQVIKPTTIFLVPLYVETFHKTLTREAEKQGVSVASVAKAFFGGRLQVLVSGGAKLDGRYVDAYKQMGIELLQGYGISECSPVVAVNTIERHRIGSVGPALSHTLVKVRNPDDHGIGEICVRGDIVMAGYLKNEKATADAFDGDWFRTGDLGYIDEDGFIFITGRIKNLIILSNGKNVSAEELEQDLMRIAGITEVLVYEHEDKIMAEIFPDVAFWGTEDEAQLQKLLWTPIEKDNAEKPMHKRIGELKIRLTEFPKTSSKKIKR